MRFVIVALVTLTAAALATLYAVENPGYVLIARAPWSVEMSLTVFVLLSVASFVVLYLLLYLIVRLTRIPADVAHWREHRQVQQAREALYRGLTRLAEGKWAAAEIDLLASMRGTEARLLAYLGAAYANQAMGRIDKRDEYLAGAQRIAPQHAAAVSMTQANLQYFARQPEQALATLTELHARAPDNDHVLMLLAQLYLDLRDWPNLIRLVGELRERQVMPAREIDSLERRAHRELLALSLPQQSTGVLKRAWDGVPVALRSDPALIAIYARHLIQQNAADEAERLLRTAIAHQWDDSLVELYGMAGGESPQRQLETAETWLVRYPQHPGLLLALGRIAVRAGNDVTARGYLERCIKLRGPLDAHHELGGICERAGDTVRALACYRSALAAFADERQGSSARPVFGLGVRARAAR